mmetsp:Transcript_22429/g.42334  ORF Transcript_22429/g.42334 Transcript_22429/m.42334 type:complete len:235 (-) Transcript_22429:200-904(-)
MGFQLHLLGLGHATILRLPLRGLIAKVHGTLLQRIGLPHQLLGRRRITHHRSCFWTCWHRHGWHRREGRACTRAGARAGGWARCWGWGRGHGCHGCRGRGRSGQGSAFDLLLGSQSRCLVVLQLFQRFCYNVIDGPLHSSFNGFRYLAHQAASIVGCLHGLRSKQVDLLNLFLETISTFGRLHLDLQGLDFCLISTIAGFGCAQPLRGDLSICVHPACDLLCQLSLWLHSLLGR